MALTRITKGVIKPNENYDTHNINSTGIVTAIGLDINGNGDVSGNLSVGGVLTYEDVTSIDSVGIITAQKDIHVGAGVSAVGVGTFGSLDIGGDIDVDGHTNLDNVSIAGVVTATTFSGSGASLTGIANANISASAAIAGSKITPNFVAQNIFTTGTVTSGDINISDATPTLTFTDTDDNPDFRIAVGSNAFNFTDVTNNVVRLKIASDGKVSVTNDFDVDGHTNLDNVSIAGVTTVAGNIIGSQSQTFIGADTSDGSDNKSMMLGGGGASSVSRGAYVWVKGNEYSGAGGELILAGGGVSSSLIDFYTNSGQRARITSTGELNIGGSYTQTTNKLNVTGTTYVSSDITSGDDIIAADEIRNNVPGDFWASDNTFINLNGFGNLTHQGGFEVNLTSNGYRDTNGQWQSLAANSNTGAAQIGLQPQGNIIFRNDASKSNGTAHNPTERLRITSAGKIGINESSPDALLHLKNISAAGVVAGIRFESSGTSNNAGDTIGQLEFAHNDANDAGVSATIKCVAEDTAGNTYLTFNNGNPGSVGERLRITSGGAVMINTTNSSSRTLNLKGTFGILSANQTGVLDMSVTDGGEASIGPYVAGGSSLVFKTNSSGAGVAERLRIATDGTITTLGTTARSDWITTTLKPSFQIASNYNPWLSLFKHSADPYGPYLCLGKTRGTSATSNTVVQNNDELGNIMFEGTDGSTFRPGARIVANVDGTPGSSDMPTRLSFHTTSDGGNNVTERLRITNTGAFYIKSPNGSTGDQPGEIQWWNENGAGVMAKIVAHREGSTYAPSGLKFYTTQNVDTSANNSQGNITERLFINSEGKFYKGGNQFYPCVQIYEARISGAVSSSTGGAYQDIKTIATYTPKKSGNRVHVQMICQTWHAPQVDGPSADTSARLTHNNSGSVDVFTECDRVQGNFAMDERYHHFPFIMDGWFTTTTTNSTTIKLQGYQPNSMSIAFNWFHAYGGRITIMEYDIT